jgi:hypothetical protein
MVSPCSATWPHERENPERWGCLPHPSPRHQRCAPGGARAGVQRALTASQKNTRSAASEMLGKPPALLVDEARGRHPEGAAAAGFAGERRSLVGELQVGRWSRDPQELLKGEIGEVEQVGATRRAIAGIEGQRFPPIPVGVIPETTAAVVDSASDVVGGVVEGPVPDGSANLLTTAMRPWRPISLESAEIGTKNPPRPLTASPATAPCRRHWLLAPCVSPAGEKTGDHIRPRRPSTAPTSRPGSSPRRTLCSQLDASVRPPPGRTGRATELLGQPPGPTSQSARWRGSGEEEDRHTARQAGFDCHLGKPVDRRRVLGAVYLEFPSNHSYGGLARRYSFG